MTLDGHIKTGLAATLFLSVATPFLLPSVTGITLSVFLISFCIGNIGPDISEMGIIRHRTHTHFPFYYLLIGGGLLFLVSQGITSPLWSWAGIGYCAGCLLHIICDIPYGKIPYFSPKKGITLMRIPFDSKTNRFIEHAAVLAFVVSFLLWDIDVNEWINNMPPTTEGFEEVVSGK